MRRRVAYSLAIVRLILVPVILLSIYYLFRMGRIVDHIVNVHASVAMQAERGTVEILDATRAERNFFLLHDAADLESNQASVKDLQKIIQNCRLVEPDESGALVQMKMALDAYQQSMDQAAQRINVAGQPPVERLRGAVGSYENDLNQIFQRSRNKTRAELIQELHERTSSFDTEIAAAGTEDPAIESISAKLRSSAESFLNLAAGLESRNWELVKKDHQDARRLIRRAEWVLGSVSFLTLLISIWFSFLLPREVVQPLVDLKQAVDHAAGGNYEIEFDLEGKGEVVELANSVRNLIDHVRETRENLDPT